MRVYGPIKRRWLARPPQFRGGPVTLDQLANFMRTVMRVEPFGPGAGAPQLRFGPGLEGRALALTQRQVAFLVANVLMGNDVAGGNGLSTMVRRCSRQQGVGDWLLSLLSLLAVLSRELAGGTLPGNVLVAATPGQVQDSAWRARLQSAVLPVEVHKELGRAESNDFMAGGIAGQAVTDIAGTVVGGGAGLCSLTDSQDESLVQFYGEVLAFAFFAAPRAMLPVPWLLLGARRYMATLTGRSAAEGPFMNRCGHIAETNWLNDAIPVSNTRVAVGGVMQNVPSSAFVAVASAISSFANCSHGDAVNNNCESQRRHADADILRWFQAFEPSMYAGPIQGAVAAVVRRIGTGPWGAGVWWGDSQHYFLTVLLASSLLGHRPALDYYLYDHFCENPGNQCFVLGAAGCAICVLQSKSKDVNWSRCGATGYPAVLQRFVGGPAHELYSALKSVGGPPLQVFDILTQWPEWVSAMVKWQFPSAGLPLRTLKS